MSPVSFGRGSRPAGPIFRSRPCGLPGIEAGEHDAVSLSDNIRRCMRHPPVRVGGLCWQCGIDIRTPIGVVVVVERAHKSDRLIHPFNVGGAEMPVVSVDVARRLDVAITVRDRDGRVLYQVDPENHMTIVAKRMMERTRPVSAAPTHDTAGPGKAISSPSDRELPDGCEGAFSPYAAPGMAHVIGRCVSGVAGNVRMASASH
jgi:hypothetical protein